MYYRQKMKNETLQFKVSASLKNIIGKDLITDDLIAVFELVKNSFDAHATQVKLIFKGVPSKGKGGTVFIEDNGKGMDYDDIKNKWLFVAYSAKQDGTEDTDYRNKIKSKRFFAGAKGIGRFSCDRLGAKLKLVSIKDIKASKAEILSVDWDEFEKDSKKDFIKVDVLHDQVNSSSYPFKHGTVLEISNLRNSWDREKLQKLKHSLEKLINPNQDPEVQKFSITIEAEEELKNDKKEKLERNQINGPVKNLVFETLKLKTTQVITSIDDKAEFVTTELRDRGTFIYKITERNEYPALANTKLFLFYLNHAAKINFVRIMGIDAVSYGSVFLYKNGFRVYPFGEEGEDRFGIDRRKQQGYNRNLGTREVMGRIEVNSNDDSFKEASSRDGGLIRTASYNQLEDCFMDKTLKRLERYVVDVQWPIKDESESLDKIKDPVQGESSREAIVNIISLLTKSKDITHFSYNDHFLDIINSKQQKSIPRIAQNFARIAKETNDPVLYKTAKQAEKQAVRLQAAKEEAEMEVENKEKELEKKQVELEREQKTSLFLQSAVGAETKAIISMQHHIDHASDRIRRTLDALKISIQDGADQKKLFSYVDIISLENKKVSTLARFVTKANFSLMSNTIEQDIVQFIREYIERVYKEYSDLIINKTRLDVQVFAEDKLNFIYKFRPLEVVIIIDNLLNNAQKAKAKSVDINIKAVNAKELRINFRDDGKGVGKDIAAKIFDFGYTTTEGSGLGLFHAKQIVEKMNGEISINQNIKKGAEFIIVLKK
jgi:signal transduction histidine kinase